MNGVLVVDKPAGFTSFDVVAVARKLCHQKKIGHTGTLDPNATGVLVLLLGSAAKAQDIIPNHDKEYEAELQLGLTSDTLDIWGEVQKKADSKITRSELEEALGAFRGEIEQIPPMYSAVSVGGQRLYDLARKGIEVERKARKAVIYKLELCDFDELAQIARLKVSCSRGTYIRTLIDDIGAKLKVGAVMTALRRTCACGFSLSDALTLDEFRALSGTDGLGERLMTCESLFESYPAVSVSDAQAKRFSNGGALDLARTSLRDKGARDGGLFRVKDRDGRFLGLGVIKGEELRIYKLF